MDGDMWRLLFRTKTRPGEASGPTLLKNALHFVINLKLVWLFMSECGRCIVTIMGGGGGVARNQVEVSACHGCIFREKRGFLFVVGGGAQA